MRSARRPLPAGTLVAQRRAGLPGCLGHHSSPRSRKLRRPRRRARGAGSTRSRPTSTSQPVTIRSTLTVRSTVITPRSARDCTRRNASRSSSNDGGCGDRGNGRSHRVAGLRARRRAPGRGLLWRLPPLGGEPRVVGRAGRLVGFVRQRRRWFDDAQLPLGLGAGGVASVSMRGGLVRRSARRFVVEGPSRHSSSRRGCRVVAMDASRGHQELQRGPDDLAPGDRW